MAIRIPTVSSCLGCCSLRTGSKLFGMLSLIVNLLLSTTGIFYLFYVAETASMFFESADEYRKVLLEALLSIAFDLMLFTMQVTTSVLLLMAAYQEKHSLIPPWLVSTVIMAVAELVYLPNLYHFVVTIELYTVEWIFFTIVSLVDDIYGWLVVYSYYHTLTPQAG